MRVRRRKTAICDSCGKEFIPVEAETICILCRYKKMELSNERYVVFLERMVERLKAGLNFSYYNCDEIGAKEFYCSWGKCSRDAEAWPDAEDHLWPDEFIKRGRVAPKYNTLRNFCPFDRRVSDHFSGKPEIARSPDGCFYRCMIFCAKGSLPTRKEAILLYEAQIVRARKGG